MTLEQAIDKYALDMHFSTKEARDDVERLITTNMQENGYSREFAENTVIEDIEDTNIQEIDAMTLKAKECMPRAQSDKPTKRNSKPKKANIEKRTIIGALLECAQNNWDNVKVANPERQIDFSIDSNNYSITITCHRAKKEG